MTTDVRGMRALVMGLGRFGGGVGVTRWLVDRGARVTVTDLATRESLGAALDPIRSDLDGGRIRARFGEHAEEDFRSAEIVVVNPGVARPWDNRFVRAARSAGARITTEMVFHVEHLPAPERVIVVTGTAGKSTTSAMIAHALRAHGERAWLGGNLGGSMLSDLPRIGARDWVVLELSSAMGHWLREALPDWRAGIAAVTNFAPNHLDWHGSLEHYRDSKAHLLQGRPDEIVVLADDSAFDAFARTTRRRVIRPSDVSGLRLAIPGAHNRVNASTAASVVVAALKAPVVGALESLRTFEGLPHRLRLVGQFALSDGGALRAYDDSKSTTPESAIRALCAFDDEGTARARIHLIAGGYDKGVELAPLAEEAAACAGVYAIGATGEALAGLVNARGGRARFCGTLERAVEAAIERAGDGDLLLLSPACASWDQFTNFEERGRAFVEALRTHLGGGTCQLQKYTKQT